VIILDTNVVSGLMREPSDVSVTGWLDRQPRTSIWITSITVLEVRFGLQIMPQGRRRAGRSEAFERLLNEKLERRVVPFDADAAEETAVLTGARQQRGQPREIRDSMIAGIALSRRAALATGNVRHFDDVGIDLVDPWGDAAT
jgi:predicted nucleic acid-binding protein